MKNVFFHHIKTNESWTRDHRQSICHEAERRRRPSIGVSMHWGGKYPPYDDDDTVPTRIAEELELLVFYPKIIMEGGSS